MGRRIARAVRLTLGDRPRLVLLFVTPTALAIALDFILRGRSLVIFPPKEWLNYFGSSLASAGFWGGPLWLASRLLARRSVPARIGFGVFTAVFVFPLAFFCFGGQPLYYRVFHYYMGRDTVRLGIALRGTLGAWLASWGASVFLMAAVGIAVTAAIVALLRRAAEPARAAWPILPILGFGVATYCFWIDFVESRSLQAAPPDTCFIHGVMHALRDRVTGKGWVRQGISLREPLPLPPLTPAAHRPNVLVILTESVRADAMCSAPARCRAPFLDEVAPERLPLGRLTMQSSGTFTSCVVLWTGLAPDADFRTMHNAPVLWEVAHAVGYRTAYIGSQNLRYDDFGAFLKRAGIDVQASAVDLGGASEPHVGAPDENATARMLAFVREVPDTTPYFAVLHLSNTHWPYRTDPSLPDQWKPEDTSPFGDIQALHNHYRNSVLLQEHTVVALLRELRALPSWDDTVVLFLSDHGEEFREHGGLYHLTSLFDEQVRVPGWLLAGTHVLEPAQRTALAMYEPRRTYTQDVYATVLDLFGVLDQKSSFPFTERLTGRSLLRPPPPGEPLILLSTKSGVWQPDVAKFGAMRGDLLAVRTDVGGYVCYDAQLDPRQLASVSSERCVDLVAAANRGFGPPGQ
jgi:hypothetical protein